MKEGLRLNYLMQNSLKWSDTLSSVSGHRGTLCIKWLHLGVWQIISIRSLKAEPTPFFL